MKKPVTFFLATLSAYMVQAQIPQAMNYQAIVRGANGNPVAANTNVSLRFTITNLLSGGTILYQETQLAVTNQFGLITAAIGNGTPAVSTFNSINWASGNKFLKVETDVTGGANYANMGTSQLLSVPYALHAGTSSSISGDTNYIAKFTGNSTVGVSSMYDNGESVGIGTTFPFAPLTVYSTNISSTSMSGYPNNINSGMYSIKSVLSDAADNVGVCGVAINPSNSNWSVGGLFSGNGSNANAYGVYAQARTTNTATNYGIYARAAGGATNYAGYFSGNVTVTGTLSKGGGTFKIDHPLDPANKYLYHSFVESPDMMNIYDGNIITDANGTAVVYMPEYFDALNKDFRYQLTTIGQQANAWVEKEISDNRFTIQCNKPNVKISWMVTGVRKDRWANANRVMPEVEKTGTEKGKYIHPQLWGLDDKYNVDPAVSGIK